MSKNVIELNGKRYDAVTGVLLGTSKAVPAATPVSAPRKQGVIDGFIRPAHTATRPLIPAAAPKKPLTHQPLHASPLAAPKKQHHSAHHIKAHRPEHAKTLMRHAVHKPQTNLKPAIKPQAPAEIAPKQASSLMHKRSVAQVDPQRMQRAVATPQHTAVRHFESPVHNVRKQPGLIPIIAVRPAPVSRPVPQLKPPTDIFEAAIAHANSHQQPAHKPARRAGHRRTVNALASVGALLVVGGFLAWLNMPRIQLNIASIQAGFKAELPDYSPTGYALQDGIKRSGNTISMNFRSGENSYTITQQPSDWNSQTLLDNTLALNGEHETVEAQGRTVYVYGEHDAVWVDGNVRYDITGNAPLTRNDIASLAKSL